MSLSVRKVASSGLLFWILISLVGIYFLLHLNKFINFGIDLVGGTYITLEVHTDKAVEHEVTERLSQAVSSLKKNQLPLPVSQRIEKSKGLLTFETEQDAAMAERALYEADHSFSGKRTHKTIQFELPASQIKTIEHEAVQGNINVLRARLDQFGVSEIPIAAQGDKHIIVELPNVHNPQQAKAIIGKSALLEIKLVEDAAPTEHELLSRYGGSTPDGMMVVPSKGKHKEFLLVPTHTDITGRLLKDARMDFGGHIGVEPVVKFVFKSEGGERFYELTSANFGRRVAIIIDGVAITAPRVQAAISTEGEITGDFTAEEAQELALLLKSGAFVAPVSFEEERHIGPSLGRESIRQGLLACGVGLLALFVFSILVYKVAGLFAFIVLLYNLLLILFALAAFGATLTLPGIAGMILTIGMAIDASILIYERIREELDAGASVRKAVQGGFSNAMAVILDANITHFIVAAVLYKFGAGPIQGFAVTMIIGIISTLLTGLLLLRSIFNFYIDVLGIQKLKI